MHYQETNKHWCKFVGTIKLLHKQGKNDTTVIAVLATESFFRPTLHRTFEYLYWLLLDSISIEKTKYISVGISQVQVRHWLESKLISSSTNQISTIMKFSNPFLNYDVCQYFLSKYQLNGNSGKEIMKIYTGKTTRYHINIYNHFLSNVRELAQKRL